MEYKSYEAKVVERKLQAEVGKDNAKKKAAAKKARAKEDDGPDCLCHCLLYLENKGEQSKVKHSEMYQCVMKQYEA
jgi:hypothetical protein